MFSIKSNDIYQRVIDIVHQYFNPAEEEETAQRDGENIICSLIGLIFFPLSFDQILEQNVPLVNLRH